MAESFNATIKKELIHLHTWPEQGQERVVRVYRSLLQPQASAYPDWESQPPRIRAGFPCSA
jgi:hypothetical protein